MSTLLDVLERERPGLALAYLPHLDYDLQRFGPDEPEARAAAAAVDGEAGRLLDHAAAEGIAVVVVSEYGITPVTGAVEPNRALRRAGLLAVHSAANGALLDPGYSRAFAVCDHQCAHVYVAAAGDVSRVRQVLEGLDGVAAVHGRDDYPALGLDHPRSGELFLVAAADRWFAYPYWDGDDAEPDFARTVDIHRKPGYDPCELFLDPAKPLVRMRVAAKLLGKKLNLRTLMNVVPVDPGLVRGSHGRTPAAVEDGPVWIGPAELLPAGLAAGAPVPAAAALAALPA